jgi:hypothetical protein
VAECHPQQNIAENGDRLVKILNSREYRKYFSGLEGEKLKLPPRGYAKDHPHIELIKMKSFLPEKSLSDDEVTAPDFFETVTGAFRAMKPVIDFLTGSDRVFPGGAREGNAHSAAQNPGNISSDFTFFGLMCRNVKKHYLSLNFKKT